jgi:hypothetical protein
MPNPNRNHKAATCEACGIFYLEGNPHYCDSTSLHDIEKPNVKFPDSVEEAFTMLLVAEAYLKQHDQSTKVDAGYDILEKSVRSICDDWVKAGFGRDCFWEDWVECPSEDRTITPMDILTLLDGKQRVISTVDK